MCGTAVSSLTPALRSLVMMQNKGWFLGLVFSVVGVGVYWMMPEENYCYKGFCRIIIPQTNDFFHTLMSLNSLQSQVCPKCDKLRGLDICGFKCLCFCQYLLCLCMCVYFFSRLLSILFCFCRLKVALIWQWGWWQKSIDWCSIQKLYSHCLSFTF